MYSGNYSHFPLSIPHLSTFSKNSHWSRLTVFFSPQLCPFDSPTFSNCQNNINIIQVFFPVDCFVTRSLIMVCINVDFKLLSLNARGIRSFEKRKALFNWLSKSRADICFLQETCSSPEVEQIWKKQWKGDIFFSHESCHSRGTMILVKDHLDFQLVSAKVDPLGRYILIEAEIQDSPFILLNIYAPNKSADQCVFFNKLSDLLNDIDTEFANSLIVGGDFNIIFDYS